MKDYDNSPKREPMRKRKVRIGSLTAHRRWVAPARNRAHKKLKGS